MMLPKELMNDITTIRIYTLVNILKTKRLYSYNFVWDENFPAAGGTRSDGNIFFNPKMLNNLGEIAIVFAHEVLHDMLDHVTRRNNLFGINSKNDLERISESDIVLWNLAADHIVNQILFPLCSKVRNKFPVSELLDKMVDLSKEFDSEIVNNMCVEILYRFLKDNTEVEVTESSIEFDDQNLQNQNSQENQQQNNSENSCECDNDESQTNSDVQDSKNNQSNSNKSGKQFKVITSTIKTKKGKILHEEYKVIIDPDSHPDKDQNGKGKSGRPSAQGISEILDSYKSIGNIPGSLEQELEFIKSPLDLKQELIQYFRILRNGMDDISWMKYNVLNAVVNTKVSLPSFISRRVKTVIGVDSSGSISDDEYKNFISVIQGNIQYIEGVIYLCDASIQDEIDITRKFSEYDVLSKLKKLRKRKGYGGTVFDEVFDKVKKIKPDVLIFFTDLFVDFPPEPKCKVLWVVKKTHETTSVNVPYGKVVWF